MTLNSYFKKITYKHYSGWDFTGDGRFSKPRVKGKDKKGRTKRQRTIQKRFVSKLIEDENY